MCIHCIGLIVTILFLSGLCFVIPYLLHVLPVVLLITPGQWVKITLLLCFVVGVYDMMKSCVLWLYLLTIKSDEHGETASPYFGSRLAATFSNYTFFTFSPRRPNLRRRHLLSPPSPPSRLITMAFENSEYPWDARTSVLLLPGALLLLNTFQVLLRVKPQQI